MNDESKTKNHKLYIFTFTTDIRRSQILLNSAKKSNLKINILFKEKRSENQNIDKILEMREAIKELNPDDVICFVDAFDVLVNNTNEETILSKFLKFDCDLLFSSELHCYPEKYLDEMNKCYSKDSKIQYKYLNSGTYIGFQQQISKVLNWKQDFNLFKGSDQAVFISYFIANQNKKNKHLRDQFCFESKTNDNIKIDHKCEIFQCMYKLDWRDIHFKNGFLVNTGFNQTPCFVHFNGKSYEVKENSANGMNEFVKMIKLSLNVKDEIMKLDDKIRQKFDKPIRQNKIEF